MLKTKFLVLTKMSKKGFRQRTHRHTDRQTPKHPLSKCIKNNVFSMSTKSDSWHTQREREKQRRPSVAINRNRNLTP